MKEPDMSHPLTSQPLAQPLARRSRWQPRRVATVLLLLLFLLLQAAPAAGQSGLATAAPSSSNAGAGHRGHGDQMSTGDRVAAMLANAPYQDVAVAEDAGYASSIGTLGCFQSLDRGGMGVHYINGDLLDATVDVTRPEALVYELDAAGQVAGLVAHEYIVPIDRWTSSTPPALFGMDFHRHPTLPLWVLHTWLWKDNPAGVFEDWNPAVRLCPSGVPVFGTDLPRPAPAA
jgi:hypothetical protein